MKESEIEISCAEVLRELSNYIDQEIKPDLRRQIQLHFPQCGRCTAIYDGVLNVIRLVSDAQTFELPVGFSERLHARLQQKLRR